MEPHRSSSTFLISLVTAVISVWFGWYLGNVYQRPTIEWYSRPYYKIDDLAIGNIFLTNTGKIADRNITLTLSADIPTANIKIVDLTSPYKITHNDNKTTIIIEELKPGEEADITFKDIASRDDVEIYNFVSEYSHIVARPWAKTFSWGDVPVWSWFVAILLLIASFSLGLSQGRSSRLDRALMRLRNAMDPNSKPGNK